MRKSFAFLLALILLLSLSLLTAAPACAAITPRYPEKVQQVCDSAAVLSPDTVSDIRTLNERLDDADADVTVYLVTVDFLDGADPDTYAAGLFDAWNLHDDDLLLLLAPGEDAWAVHPGRDVPLSASALSKLLYTSFEGAFLAQRYDEAVCALMPVLCAELSKTADKPVSTAGLFHQPEEQAESSAPDILSDWAERFTAAYAATPAPDHTAAVAANTRSGKSDGSLGKVILTIFLLMVIFGKRRKRYYYGRRGCGCMPFSSLLAALGIWKLWDRRG